MISSLIYDSICQESVIESFNYLCFYFAFM